MSYFRKKTIIFLGILFVFPFAVFAQTKKDSVKITLQKAIEIALQDNPTIHISDRNVIIKKYYKKEQIVSLFPTASIAATYNRTLKKQKMVMDFGGQTMEIEIGTDNAYNAGLNFGLPLVVSSLWYNLKLSQLDVELALEKARSSKLDLVNQVQKAYYTVLFLQAYYQVILKSYQNAESNNKLITDKYNQELVSEFDKLRSDVQLSNLKPALSTTENTLELAKKIVKVFMSVDIDEPLIFDGDLADYEQSILAQYEAINQALTLMNNTDLKQMDIMLIQLEKTKKLITASSCPTLTLSGGYQYMSQSNDFKFSDYAWFPSSAVGITLNIPIVSWASTAYKIKQAKLSIENLKDNRQYVEQNLWLSVYANLDKIHKAIEELSAAKESIDLAQRAYDIVTKQYEIGMAIWLDLESADLALRNSKVIYYQLINDYLAAYSDLNKLLGN